MPLRFGCVDFSIRTLTIYVSEESELCTSIGIRFTLLLLEPSSAAALMVRASRGLFYPFLTHTHLLYLTAYGTSGGW